jgi:hypothetical protein
MKKITYPLFLAALSSLALPQAASAVCLDGSLSCATSAGTLQILEYDAYEEVFPEFDPISGQPISVSAEGVSIASIFTPNQSGNYRYINAIVSADAPTIFFDGTPIGKPLLDPPPGGYFGMPPGMIDLKPDYDTPPGLENSGLFGDKPGGSLEDIQSIGGNAEAKFETWLVEVVDEKFGSDPFKAQDDFFTVNPLIGFQWGYDIQNTDNGNGILDFGDFSTETQPLSWLTEGPTGDWMSALDRVYGSGETEDRFNVILADRASVPEPSSVLGLIGLGLLAAKSARKRKA